jgi:hypothetical protein
MDEYFDHAGRVAAFRTNAGGSHIAVSFGDSW